jgi:hypothetical protein
MVSGAWIGSALTAAILCADAFPVAAWAQASPLMHVANTAALEQIESTAYRTIVRDGFAAAGDAPALTFTSTPLPCPLRSGKGDGGSQVRAHDGKCWISSFPTEGADIREFGARCDGSTDDASAIKNDINYVQSIGGGTVLAPAGKACVFKSTLLISKAGVTMAGAGYAGALLVCNTGAADCIDVGFQSTQVYYTKIVSIHFVGVALKGGWMLNIYGASIMAITDSIFDNVFNGIQTQWVNGLTFRDDHVVATHDGGSALVYIHSPANNTFRSDAITFADFTAEANYHRHDCFIFDGMVNTIRITQVSALNCHYGLHVLNSAGSQSYFPAFLMANDLEIDGNTAGGVLIDGGTDFSLVNSDIDDNNPTTFAYPLKVNSDAGRSDVRGIRIVGVAVHDGPQGAAYINARNVVISGSEFFDSNHNGTGTYPQIEIGGGSDAVSISGSFAGARFGDPHPPTYGLQVDAGASHVTIGATNFSGATIAGIKNLAGAGLVLTGAGDLDQRPLAPAIDQGAAGSPRSARPER